MRPLILLFVLSQLYAVDAANALKIFVYNVKFGRSHTIYMNRISDTLAKHGFDVIDYQPIYSDDYKNIEPKLARTISRKLSYPIDFDQSFMHKFVWGNDSISEMINAMTTGVSKFHEMFAKNCRDQLSDEKMMSELKAMNFDLALVEYFDPCGLVIVERLGIKKHIGVFSMPMPGFADRMLGLPASFSFVPDLYSAQTPKMTMLERAKNMFSGVFLSTLMHTPLITAVEKVAQDLVNPDFNFLKKAGTASLVFVNTDELLDFPRPITHKVIYIGGLIGLASKKTEKLPKDLDKIFREAKKGVIYLSFGTVAPSHAMPHSSKQAFLEAFSTFPDITFLWKYEKPEDGIADKYPNVITQEWFPQQALLAHPKLLTFITHSGGNSLAEASYAGKPIIAIPLFADQHRNAKTAEWHGYGEILEKQNLTKEAIVNAIKKIISTDSYRHKAEEMARVLASKPFPIEELFVKNVQFAANFDIQDRFDLYGRHLGVIEYYNLDIFATALLITLVSSYVFYRIVKLLVCCLMRRKKSKTE